MSARDTVTSYGSLTRSLHWVLFILIVIQFTLALSFGFFPKHSSAKSAAIMLHESTGVLILIFGVIFILWRWNNPKPSLESIPAWQRGLARLVHIIIYIAVIAQPIFGIMLVMTHGHPVAFYGLLHIPQFVPASKGAGHVFGVLHAITGWWILLIALLVHLLGALYHRFVAKDQILLRMWKGGERG